MYQNQNEELYQRYQTQLREAMDADESATAALQRGRAKAAAELYARASALYAAAASTLLDMGEASNAAERGDIEASVERLIETSKELKAYAAQVAQRPEAIGQPSQSAPADGDDSGDARFVPVGAVPQETFDDIAGLAEAKQMVLDEIINPLVYGEFYRRFHIESNGGLLLFGPPGSGKTMMARAIANRANMAFFPVRCSDIVGKYFGEAEKRVRALFAAAREARNAVIFLDEAEALACRRGGNSTVMNRLVPELLSQMDGFERFDGHVIVIFATNRPYDIDPAFMRPGRLPNHCYIPLPDLNVRRAFLARKLEGLPCGEEIDVDALARRTERFSCADLTNLIKRACQRPVNRCIARRESGAESPEEFLRLTDLNAALEALHPSVEPAEIERLEKWMQRIGIPLPQAV